MAGELSATLGAATCVSAGGVKISATLAGSLADMASSSGGRVRVAGSLGPVDLSPVVSTSAAKAIAKGDTASILAPLTCSATFRVSNPVYGSLAKTLDPVRASSFVGDYAELIASITLDDIGSFAIVNLRINAAAALTLAPIGIAASFTATTIITGSATLAPMAASSAAVARITVSFDRVLGNLSGSMAGHLGAITNPPRHPGRVFSMGRQNRVIYMRP